MSFKYVRRRFQILQRAYIHCFDLCDNSAPPCWTNEDTFTYTLQMRTHLPIHYKWGHTYLYTTNEDTLTCTLQMRTHLPVHYKWGHTYLYTTGDGTQNLTNVFLIFSCRILWSMYQAAWVSPSGPAVGSTVIQIELHLLLRLGYNRIVWCIKLFKNHEL